MVTFYYVLFSSKHWDNTVRRKCEYGFFQIANAKKSCQRLVIFFWMIKLKSKHTQEEIFFTYFGPKSSERFQRFEKFTRSERLNRSAGSTISQKSGRFERSTSLTKASSNDLYNFWQKKPELFETSEALVEFEFGSQTIKNFGSVLSIKYYMKQPIIEFGQQSFKCSTRKQQARK